jgi:hypothetical protein
MGIIPLAMLAVVVVVIGRRISRYRRQRGAGVGSPSDASYYSSDGGGSSPGDRPHHGHDHHDGWSGHDSTSDSTGHDNGGGDSGGGDSGSSDGGGGGDGGGSDS